MASLLRHLDLFLACTRTPTAEIVVGVAVESRHTMKDETMLNGLRQLVRKSERRQGGQRSAKRVQLDEIGVQRQMGHTPAWLAARAPSRRDSVPRPCGLPPSPPLPRRRRRTPPPSAHHRRRPSCAREPSCRRLQPRRSGCV